MDRPRRSSRNIELANKIVKNLENKKDNKSENKKISLEEFAKEYDKKQRIQKSEKEGEIEDKIKNNQKKDKNLSFEISDKQKEALDMFFANSQTKSKKQEKVEIEKNVEPPEDYLDSESRKEKKQKKNFVNKYSISNIDQKDFNKDNLLENTEMLTPQEKKEILKEQVKTGKIPYKSKQYFNENLGVFENDKEENFEEIRKKQEVSLQDFQDMMEREQKREEEKKEKNMNKNFSTKNNFQDIKNDTPERRLSISKIIIAIELIIILFIIVFTIISIVRPNIILKNKFLSKIFLNKKESTYSIKIDKIELDKNIYTEKEVENNAEISKKEDNFIVEGSLENNFTNSALIFVENEKNSFIKLGQLEKNDKISIKVNNDKKDFFVEKTEEKNIEEIKPAAYNKQNTIYIFVPIKGTNDQLIIEAKSK